MPPQLPVCANALRQLFLNAPVNLERQLLLRTTSQLRKPQPRPLNCHRNFSQSPPLLKKKGKADRGKDADAKEQAEKSPAGKVEDPFDFSRMTEAITADIAKLKDDLAKLRTGGKFNPEVLDNVRVHLLKDSRETEKLGDLAQVLPKAGRSVTLVVGEKDHVKPIISAIQGSRALNLQPQPDPHNPLQLNIPIPPPTKESRDLALAMASKAGEAANTGIKNARAVTQKRLNSMFTTKSARQDDVGKAQKAMEKIVKNETANVKQFVDDARKAMGKA